jgi:hypothetical protein
VVSPLLSCVYIEWEDATSLDDHLGWHQEDACKANVNGPAIFRQVGFVFSIDLDHIVLTEAHDLAGLNVAPRTRIPMGMVRRWVDLDKVVASKGKR